MSRIPLIQNSERYRIRKGQLDRHWRVAHGLPDDSVVSLWRDVDGSLLVGTAKGMSLMRGDRLSLPVAHVGGDRVNAIYRRRDGTLWVGTDQAILVLRSETVLARYPQSWEHSQIFQFLEDRDGCFWIASYGKGLLRFRDTGFEVYDPSSGFIDRRSWVVIEDREGNLWSGTRSGLVRLRDGPVVSWAGRQGLADEHVRAVHEDPDGSLWFAHLNGISRFDKGRIENFGVDQGLVEGVYRSLLRDRRGRLWAAGEFGISVQTANGWRRFDQRDGLPSNNVKIARETRDGRIYTGHLGGVAYIEDDKVHQPAALMPLNGTSIEALEEDRAGTLWIGTLEHGFWRWRDGQLDSVRLDAVSEIGVRSIYEDADGRLWIGSADNGLYLLAEGELMHISSREGLPSNGIWSIIDDDQGRLWFSSDRGLFRVSRQSLLATLRGKRPAIDIDVLLGQQDGMKSQEANGGGRPAAIRASDGRFWFATAGGAVVVDPNALSSLPDKLDVRIEELVVQDSSIMPVARTPTVTEARALEWVYTSLHLADPGALRFRYRLLGQSEDWVEAGARRVAYYTNLAPGDYRFEVQVRHARGSYDGDVAVADLRILPMWHERADVRGLGLFMLLLTIGGAVGLRLRTQRGLAALLRREVDLRTQELSIANDELARIAAVDGLTSAATPREFWRRFGIELAEAGARTPLSLLLIDVDDFKAYNDSYGHVQGDACLRHIADVLRTLIAASPALVARYGGEEFAVLLPGTDAMQARAIADLARLRVQALSIPSGVGARHDVATISVGIATTNDPSTPPAQLTEAADAALYEAKRGGRNRIQSAASA